MSKKIFQIKGNYKNNNYTVFECIKDFFKIFGDEFINYSKDEAKKITDNINN